MTSIFRSRLAFLICVCYLATPRLALAHDVKPVRIPLTFEQNEGQADKSARFLAPSGRGTVLLTKDGLVLSPSHGASRKSVRLHWLHAASVAPVAESPTGGFANYYTSNNRKHWLSHIPMFSRVRYAEIYRGIDVVFHGHENQLEYDIVVSPGGNPSDIQFRIDGAERLSVTADGSLEVTSVGETWRLLPPAAHQLRGGIQDAVLATYHLSPNQSISLNVGSYDRDSTLVIDPVVDYANFLPSSVLTGVAGVQLDAQGGLFVAGTSGDQVGLIKLNSSGNSIIYSTHIGTNTSPSGANALTLDSNGDAYIAGITSAEDFPVTSSNLGSCGGFCNAGFVAKFASDGSLAYSTLLGSGQELPRAITVDTGGSAYVAGLAADDLLQTVNAFQTSYGGVPCTSCENAFFAKLNPAGTNYVFASYFSGPVPAGAALFATGIVLDSAGNILLSGETNVDPPLVNPWESGAGGAVSF